MSFCKKFKNFQKPVFAKLCQFDADLTFAIEKFQKFDENQISLISVENFHYTKKLHTKSQFLTFRAKFYEFECRSIWKLIRTFICVNSRSHYKSSHKYTFISFMEFYILFFKNLDQKNVVPGNFLCLQ